MSIKAHKVVTITVVNKHAIVLIIIIIVLRNKGIRRERRITQKNRTSLW